MHSQSTASRPQSPNAEALEQGIERLPLRDPEMMLIATFQMMPQPVLDVPVHRREHPTGMAAADVIPPPHQPAVDLIDHPRDRGGTPVAARQIPELLALDCQY
jgi:hypothetical protein